MADWLRASQAQSNSHLYHSLMPLDTVCGGCGHTWSESSHLTQHLQKTMRPECLKYRDDVLNFHRPVKGGGWRNPKRGPSPKGNEASSQFEGDFFGNDYDDRDFPMRAPDSPSFSGSINESHGQINEDDNLDVYDHESEDEVGLDILLGDVAQPGFVTSRSQDVDRMFAEPSIDGPPSDEPINTSSARPQLSSPPRHIDTFGGRAGEPMAGHDENSKYGTYRDNVFGATEQNPWAPFTSKVDWEVARWAKLRGSGSTAFSDLLGVENVSVLDPYARC